MLSLETGSCLDTALKQLLCLGLGLEVVFLVITAKLIKSRNSAIADKPRDAFVQYAMAWLTS